MKVTAPDENSRCSAELRLSKDFIGFQGHFPGRPVLPAVCMISAVLTAAQAAVNSSLSLKTVKSAKFFSPLVPDEPLTFDITLDDPREPKEVRAELSSEGRKIARITLLTEK